MSTFSSRYQLPITGASRKSRNVSASGILWLKRFFNTQKIPSDVLTVNINVVTIFFIYASLTDFSRTSRIVSLSKVFDIVACCFFS